MINREQIYSALFAKLRAIPAFGTASRRLRHWDDVPAVDQPALFQTQKPEQPEQQPGLPTKWTLAVDVYIYANTAGEDPPAAIINPLIDSIEAAIAPDPVTNKCTLGGLVSHVWIDGEIQNDEGVLGDQAVAIVPIRILAS